VAAALTMLQRVEYFKKCSRGSKVLHLDKEMSTLA